MLSVDGLRWDEICLNYITLHYITFFTVKDKEDEEEKRTKQTHSHNVLQARARSPIN